MLCSSSSQFCHRQLYHHHLQLHYQLRQGVVDQWRDLVLVGHQNFACFCMPGKWNDRKHIKIMLYHYQRRQNKVGKRHWMFMLLYKHSMEWWRGRLDWERRWGKANGGYGIKGISLTAGVEQLSISGQGQTVILYQTRAQ